MIPADASYNWRACLKNIVIWCMLSSSRRSWPNAARNWQLPTKHTTAIGMLRLDDVPKTVHYAAMQSVISCTNYIKSCQPSGKPSEFDLLVSLAPAGYFTYLRAALLLIKLISLLSTLPSEENEVVFQSTELLCEALTELCSKLQSMDNASSGMLNLVAFSPEEGHSCAETVLASAATGVARLQTDAQDKQGNRVCWGSLLLLCLSSAASNQQAEPPQVHCCQARWFRCALVSEQLEQISYCKIKLCSQYSVSVKLGCCVSMLVWQA